MSHPSSSPDNASRLSRPGYHEADVEDPNLVRPGHHAHPQHSPHGELDPTSPSTSDTASPVANPPLHQSIESIASSPSEPLLHLSTTLTSPSQSKEGRPAQWHIRSSMAQQAKTHGDPEKDHSDSHGATHAKNDSHGKQPHEQHRASNPMTNRASTHRPGHASIFDFAHAGRTSTGHNHIWQGDINEQEPIRLRHLFKRPVIRQWLYNGDYYREKDERQSSRFELFSDLLFVGVVHQLADGLAEGGAATALNVLKFVLVFYPAFSIWSDLRRQLNMSGTDDCYQRFYVLTVMLLLVGYTSNAAGIIIHQAEEGIILDSDSDHTSANSGSVPVDHFARHIRRAISSTARNGLENLSVRSGVAHSGSPDPPILVEPIGSTGYWFAEGYHKALYSAIGFYLGAKLLKLLLHFIYGLCLPKFRTALWLEMVPIFLLACTYLPLIFVYHPGWICGIIVAGISIDIISKYVINLLLQSVHHHYKRKGKPIFIPAQSVEHLAERTILFVVLVTGECILNSTFVATPDRYGLSVEYLRAGLSVVNSFYLVWIYFDCDASRTFLHALRVNPWSAISFSLLHYPLCASLILLSSAIPRLITEDKSEAGYRWFYASSLSVAMFCMALIGLLHRNLDLAGSSYWSHRARIALRILCAAIFALIPLENGKLNNLLFLWLYNGILALLVLSETIGKLGVVGRRFDQDKADAYYAALKGDDAIAATEGLIFHEHRERGGRGSRLFNKLGAANFSPLHVNVHNVNDSLVPVDSEGSAEKNREQQPVVSTTTLRYPPAPQQYRTGTGPFAGRPESTRSRGSILSQSAANLNRRVDAVINPHTSHIRLRKTDSWHPYEDLMGDERGDEDVGVEGELGHMEVKERMDAGQRWALVAN